MKTITAHRTQNNNSSKKLEETSTVFVLRRQFLTITLAVVVFIILTIGGQTRSIVRTGFSVDGIDASIFDNPFRPDGAKWASSLTTNQLGSNSNSNDGSNFELAKLQSFGFFDDISNDNWREAQRIHAESFPNHFTTSMLKYSNGPADKGDYGKLAKSGYWNGENFQVEFHCPLTRRVPPNSQADGPKFVCDPHRLVQRYEEDKQRLANTAGEGDNVQPKKCLIYSFGSNGKAEFEQGMKDIVGDACEIHTFDLQHRNNRFGDFAQALKGLSTFHHWGLGTVEEAKRNPTRFKTLPQTMEELGHTGRTIDIFKIDCEWCEWFTHPEWFGDLDDDGNKSPIDIRQILIETHNAPMPNAKEFFYGLHDRGYVIFSKEANYQNGAGGVEFAFLKLSREFFEAQKVQGSLRTGRIIPADFRNKTHYFYGDPETAKATAATTILPKDS